MSGMMANGTGTPCECPAPIEGWDEYAECPWRRERRTVYEWLADHPELYDATVWSPRGEDYCAGAKIENVSAVYLLLGPGDVILYIGKSVALATRLCAHDKAGRIPFVRVAWIEVGPRDALEPLEAYLIGLDGNVPPYNAKFDPTMQRHSERLAAEIYRRNLRRP